MRKIIISLAIIIGLAVGFTSNNSKASALNPEGYTIVAEQLDKMDKDVLDLLARTGLQIYYSDETIDKYEDDINLADGSIVLGFYNVPNNYIVLRQDNESIEGALIHELGHALDFNLGLRYNKALMDSYMNQEVSFTNANNSAYYYTCIEEYIAESIAEYYNGTLAKDTVIYQELNFILD